MMVGTGSGEHGFVCTAKEAMMINSSRLGEAALDRSPESPRSPPHACSP